MIVVETKLTYAPNVSQVDSTNAFRTSLTPFSTDDEDDKDVDFYTSFCDPCTRNGILGLAELVQLLAYELPGTRLRVRLPLPAGRPRARGYATDHRDHAR